MRIAITATALALVTTSACSRDVKSDAPTVAKVAPSSAPSPSGTPANPSSSSKALPASGSAAPEGASARAFSARTCKLGAPVFASEGRGGITHAIAKGARDVVVTWGELRPASDKSGAFPENTKQRFELARVFDSETLAPRAPAKVLVSQAAIDAVSNGAAPVTAADGSLATAACEWVAYAGNLSCVVTPEGPSTSIKSSRYRESVPGPGPQTDRIAATQLEDETLVLLPQCQDVRVISSASNKDIPLFDASRGALGDCNDRGKADVPAITTGGGYAYAVARRNKVLQGRKLGKGGKPEGAAVTLGLPKAEVGAPSIAWNKSRATVAYATRPNATSPYAIAFTHWSPDGTLARASVATGGAAAVAPSLVATSDAGCFVLSWTEGTGAATRVRAGLVCNDVLEPASVVDISEAGVEAGDSELAGDGTSNFVVWQELPKGKPAALKLAKLTCE